MRILRIWSGSGALEKLRSDIKLPSVVRLPDTNLDAAVRIALSVTGTLPMSEELLESLGDTHRIE